MRRMAGLAGLVFLAGLVAGQAATAGPGRRADVQASLEQRYRLTVVGTKLLGLSGSRGTIQRAGGVVVLRRDGLQGSFNPDMPASFALREGAAEMFRGRNDAPLPPGEKFYVHSIYVGSDLVTLGLVSVRTVSGSGATGQLWAALSFFVPPAALEQADLSSIYRVVDPWLLPEESMRAEETRPAEAPPAPAPQPAAELKAGMTRDEVVSALGPPGREVSFGERAWLTYPGLVVLLEKGRLASVDRSGQPPARVNVVSEPDGADVFLDGSFVSSTPATLDLPAGTYRVSVRLEGYGAWEREVRVLAGSGLTLRARLEKQ